MERIELSPLDKKDLLELLDYIKDVKKLNRPVLKGANICRKASYIVG